MKLLVLSDTHHRLDNAREVLRRIGGSMDMVVHLGDHDTDADVLQREFPTQPFHAVSGNNDSAMDTPGKKMLFVAGKRILLTHGHKQRVSWGYDTISYWAEEQGADAVLFGHTHRPVYEAGRVLLLNPGSISLPRGGTPPTFAVLTITENGRMEGAVMAFHPKETFARIRI